MQHLVAAAVVEHRDLLERRQRDLVGGGIAEAHVVELHRHRPDGQRLGIGRLLDERIHVEHLEHPLEAHEGGDHVEPGGGQGRERAVEAVQEQRHRDDGARIDLALDREVATQAVDQGQGQARDERERPHEHGHGHGRLHADVTDTSRPPAELVGLLRPAGRRASRGWRPGPRTVRSSAWSWRRCASPPPARGSRRVRRSGAPAR